MTGSAWQAILDRIAHRYFPTSAHHGWTGPVPPCSGRRRLISDLVPALDRLPGARLLSEIKLGLWSDCSIATSKILSRSTDLFCFSMTTMRTLPETGLCAQPANSTQPSG